MPKLSENRTPKYCRHIASGQAYVTLPGDRPTYLGSWNSAASRAEYDRIIARWIAAGRPRGGLPRAEDAGFVTCDELMDRFLRHADAYYGSDTSGRTQVKHFEGAVKVVHRLYGKTPAIDFGPLCLMAVRQGFVGLGWRRSYVNQQTQRVKRMFLWGAQYEIIPLSEKVKALETVEGLKRGKTAAPEPKPIGPVPDAQLEQAIECASPPVAAMLRLQRLTGMRPGEVCMMRGADIDRTDKKMWVYTPARHKTEGHGVVRRVYLGPRAQELLMPFLTMDAQAHLFRPSEAVAWQKAERTKRRNPKHKWGNHPGTNRVRRPKKEAGDFYTVASYRQAIEYACDRAFPLPTHLGRRRTTKANGRLGKFESRERWWARLTEAEKQQVKAWRLQHRFHPHQIRHSAATEMRRKHGLEAAQVLLGHRQLSATQIYAEQDVIAAQRIATAEG